MEGVSSDVLDTALKLQAVFPNLGLDVLLDALGQCGGDLDVAVEHLLAAGGENSAHATAAVYTGPSNTQSDELLAQAFSPFPF